MLSGNNKTFLKDRIDTYYIYVWVWDTLKTRLICFGTEIMSKVGIILFAIKVSAPNSPEFANIFPYNAVCLHPVYVTREHSRSSVQPENYQNIV